MAAYMGRLRRCFLRGSFALWQGGGRRGGGCGSGSGRVGGCGAPMYVSTITEKPSAGSGTGYVSRKRVDGVPIEEVTRPIVETWVGETRMVGGPLRLLRRRKDRIDRDWAFRDLGRLSILGSTLAEHVEFLREEGDPKLDELRYAKIQICLGKSKKIVDRACAQLGINEERLCDLTLAPMEVPKSVIGWQRQMEIYDLHDQLREFLFQMDKLEPRETVVNKAYKYIDSLPKEAFRKDPRDPEDVKPEMPEDEEESNKAALRKSFDLSQKLKGFYTTLVYVGRVSHMTRGGRVYGFQTVVGVGNLKGTGGVGVGNARSVQESVRRATRKALNRLVTVQLYEGRTIAYPIRAKSWRKIQLWPAQKGHGLRVYRSFIPILAVMGFKDMAGKQATFTKNPVADCKELMVMLEMLRTPEELAAQRNKKVFEVSKYVNSVLDEVDEIQAVRQEERMRLSRASE